MFHLTIQKNKCYRSRHHENEKTLDINVAVGNPCGSRQYSIVLKLVISISGTSEKERHQYYTERSAWLLLAATPNEKMKGSTVKRKI